MPIAAQNWYDRVGIRSHALCKLLLSIKLVCLHISSLSLTINVSQEWVWPSWSLGALEPDAIESESHVWLFAIPWTHGVVQARILEWAAVPFSRGSSQPRDRTQVSHNAGGFFTNWATSGAQEYWSGHLVKATQCERQSLHPNQTPFTSSREHLYVQLWCSIYIAELQIIFYY